MNQLYTCFPSFPSDGSELSLCISEKFQISAKMLKSKNHLIFSSKDITPDNTQPYPHPDTGLTTSRRATNPVQTVPFRLSQVPRWIAVPKNMVKRSKPIQKTSWANKKNQQQKMTMGLPGPMLSARKVKPRRKPNNKKDDRTLKEFRIVLPLPSDTNGQIRYLQGPRLWNTKGQKLRFSI